MIWCTVQWKMMVTEAVKGITEDNIGPRRQRQRAWISTKTECLVQERKEAKAPIDIFVR